MSLVYEPIRIANGENASGLLVLRDNELVAILSRLSNLHGELARHWYVECAFGGPLEQKTFADFDELEAAIEGWRKNAPHYPPTA